MPTFLSWIVLSHRYRYATDNTSIAFLTGIVGGCGIACLLIWLVFHHGVEESRLRFWLLGCAAAGIVAGVVIYWAVLPYGLCSEVFGSAGCGT